MKAVFYDSQGVANAPLTFSDRVRSDEAIFYDSFRGYRAEIPVKGNDFVLGEVYENTSVESERTTGYFVYSPSGQLVCSYESPWFDGKLAARLDGNGVSYFREHGTVYFGAGRL
jgi:hypothetical protein